MILSQLWSEILVLAESLKFFFNKNKPYFVLEIKKVS